LSSALSPRTLDEALKALANDPAIVLAAGCTDLMVRPPEALHGMERVIDLLAIPELSGIREVGFGSEAGLEIGATTTFSEIRRSATVRSVFPALADSAAQIGGLQIQNRATIGGNMANASPAGDSLPVLLALDATVVIAGPTGMREIPYSTFHTGYRKTALQPGEILAAVRLPLPSVGTIQTFRKVGTREAQAISKVVVAMVGRVEDGRIADLRLAAGSVAATPIRRGSGPPDGPRLRSRRARRTRRGGCGRSDRRRALDGRLPALRAGAGGAAAGAGARGFVV
jgi:xanthine dehydrogenase small subunit